jgi:hypothetical protein
MSNVSLTILLASINALTETITMTKTITTSNAKLHLSKAAAKTWGTKTINVTLLEIDELGNYIVELNDTRFSIGTIIQFIGKKEALKCTKSFRCSVDYEKETHTGYVQHVTRKVKRTVTFVSTGQFGAMYMSHGLEHNMHVEVVSN